MRLALGVLAYLCAVCAVIAGAFAGYQAMLPAERSATVASSNPPQREPKRIDPIRPVNEPVQTPAPKYETSGVPLTSTAAYNKKKAQQKYQHHRSAHRNSARTLPPEAANAYNAAPNDAPWGFAPPSRYAPRDRFGIQ